MKLTLGLSPCPNDTFIFDALINQKIDTEGLEFAPKFADIEQLNLLAIKGDLDVTKFSFSAFTDCFQNYLLLDSGSALGRACGPLLVKKPSTIINDNSEIAIPGNYTTANLLLKLLKNKGIINIGGKIQSIYNFAKKENYKIKKSFLKKKNKNLIPMNATMNVSKLKKILK